MSGLVCLATLIPSLPFSASTQDSNPSDKKAAAIVFLMTALSSTIKTVLRMLRFLGLLFSSIRLPILGVWRGPQANRSASF